jgi:hypothetical protein
MTGWKNFEVFKRDYSQYLSRKPNGLWLSNGEWERFCERKDFYVNVDCLNNVHLFTIEFDERKVLTISNYEELQYFSLVYRAKAAWTVKENLIDWLTVSNHYAGVLISNLEEGKHLSWYRGWDVYSACIWDTTIIKSSKLSYSKGVSDARQVLYLV